MQTKTSSLLELPTDITSIVIPPYLTLKELSQLARTSTGAKTLFTNALTFAKVLQHVAFGEQEQAEKILNENRSLLFRTGQVTDHSGRTFKDITAFQYALWALDRHMWRMILKYLPREEAVRQLYDHVYNKKAYKEMHGDYYNFALIDALQTYVINFNTWDDDQRIKHWCEVVESAKLLVPAHVANEHANQGFNPTTNFKADSLRRSVLVHDHIIAVGKHWFSALPPVNKLVRPWGIGGKNPAASSTFGDIKGPMDLAAVTALRNVRTNELVELQQQLLPDPTQTPGSKFSH